MVDTVQLRGIERYYDSVPRAFAVTEDLGPFTLFVAEDRDANPYYARPALDGGGVFTVDDVQRVRARQRELGVPEAFEWVDEISPGLATVAAEAGLMVGRYTLMVRQAGGEQGRSERRGIEQLSSDDLRVSEVNAAIGAGFGNRDAFEIPEGAGSTAVRLRSGKLMMVGAFDDEGRAIGGGFHAPRGPFSELVGIAVLPRARRLGVATLITQELIDNARRGGVETAFLSAGSEGAQALYHAVGFRRIATACIAEPAGDTE
jgi:ribosomal protein S18 acetylase RimI-like enzyme